MRHRSSTRLKLALILIAAFTVYLAGNGRVCLWDRDEPRYAQTSRQMLQSGDWVVPHLLDKVRTAKPVFIYWCQAGAMKVFGDGDFAARFPSSLAMMLTLVIVAFTTSRRVGSRRAVWTVLILASSALAIAAAKMCLTDSVLLLFVTIAQICIALLYTQSQRQARRFSGGDLPIAPRAAVATGIPLVLWISVGFAGLTKGPVVLGILLTTMIVLAVFDRLRNLRWWTHTRPLIGVVIVTIICAPWLVLIHRREPSFLPTILGHDVVDRMRSGLEGHKGPPGFYLLLICVTYFPWSLLLPATLVHAWRRRHIPVIRFALSAVIGPWVMFELVQTKLPHYILPTFPWLAFLTADMLVRTAGRARLQPVWSGWSYVVAGWGIIVVAAACLPWVSCTVFPKQIDRAAISAMAAITALAIAYVGVVAISFRARLPLRAAAAMGLGMMLIVVVLYTGYLPHASFLRTSARVAGVLHENGGSGAIMIDYKEDTLPWYEGGTIRQQRDNDYLLHNPPDAWPSFVVLTRDIWQRTPAELQSRFTVLDSIHGLAYSDGGRVVDVLILRKNPGLKIQITVPHVISGNLIDALP